jgi:hypothetical protein
VFNQPRIFNPQVSGGLFQNGTYQSPIINGGTATGQAIVGATIDCTTQVCHQPTGTCNATIASTAFVCVAIQEAVSSMNPAFCAAVEGCIANNPAAFCAAVDTCINTVNNIINTTLAFGASSRATTAQYGVVRYATQSEIENAVCSVAIDPCTLAGVLSILTNATPFGMAFETAVNNVLTGGGVLCAQVAACGFALLASPVFTGDPQAPTPPPGDNDTSIATTAFVNTEVANAIAAIPPVSCVDVVTPFSASGGAPGAGVGFLANDCLTYTAAQIVAAGGGGAGPGGTVLARAGNFRVVVSGGIGPLVTDVFAFRVGCTAVVAPASIVVTFNVPAPSTNYSVVSGGGIAIVGGAPADGIWADIAVGNKTVNGFTIAFFASALAPNIGDVYFDFAVIG